MPTTTGLVSIVEDGVVVMKIFASCNGMKASVLSDAIRRHVSGALSVADARTMAQAAGFGCDAGLCLVVQTQTEIDAGPTVLNDGQRRDLQRCFADPHAFSGAWGAEYISVITDSARKRDRSLPGSPSVKPRIGGKPGWIITRSHWFAPEYYTLAIWSSYPFSAHVFTVEREAEQVCQLLKDVDAHKVRNELTISLQEALMDSLGITTGENGEWVNTRAVTAESALTTLTAEVEGDNGLRAASAAGWAVAGARAEIVDGKQGQIDSLSNKMAAAEYTINIAKGMLDTAEAQLKASKAANERDRTVVAEGIIGIERALKAHEWLRLGRGSYEWDDDKWKDEFGIAFDAVHAALTPLRKVASDLTNCPTTTAEVTAARS